MSAHDGSVVPAEAFALVRDARGSLVHVRNTRTGECVGCIEVGLFEVVRALLMSEKTAASGDRLGEGAG